MKRSLISTFRMCDKFSESVTRILSVIEERSNSRTLRRLQDSESPMPVTAPRPFTVLVEGNIGSGKSTYLKHFYSHRADVDIITEPVNKWTDLNATGHNLLQMMYEDPKRQVKFSHASILSRIFFSFNT